MGDLLFVGVAVTFGDCALLGVDAKLGDGRMLVDVVGVVTSVGSAFGDTGDRMSLIICTLALGLPVPVGVTLTYPAGTGRMLDIVNVNFDDVD